MIETSVPVGAEVLAAKNERKEKLNTVSAEVIVQWLGDYVTTFYREYFSNGITDEAISARYEEMSKFGEIFQTFNNYFNSLLSNTGDADFINSVRQKLAVKVAEIIANNPQASKLKIDSIPLHYDVDHKNERQEEIITTYLCYLHDMANAVQGMSGFSAMIIDPEMAPYLDKQQIDSLLSQIQASLLDSMTLHKAFDLKKGKLVKEPSNLEKLVNYLRKKESEYNAKNKTTVYPQVEFMFFGKEEFSVPQGIDLKNIESYLNIPSVIRIMVNMYQNASRAYEAQYTDALFGDMESFNALNKVLRVSFDIRGDRLFLVFEDNATGFPKEEYSYSLFERIKHRFLPNHQYPSPFVNSEYDNQELRLYTPKKGKTKWGKEGKGNGTGLYGLKKAIESFGGKVVTGTKIDENLDYRGARIEISMPIRPVKKK